MGVIRKSISLGTVGLVDFRSDKERIARSTRKTSKAAKEQLRVQKEQLQQARIDAHRDVVGSAAEPPSAAADPRPAQHAEDIAAQLQRLADLQQSGLLTDEEFATAKGRLLGGPPVDDSEPGDPLHSLKWLAFTSKYDRTPDDVLRTIDGVKDADRQLFLGNPSDEMRTLFAQGLLDNARREDKAARRSEKDAEAKAQREAKSAESAERRSAKATEAKAKHADFMEGERIKRQEISERGKAHRAEIRARRQEQRDEKTAARQSRKDAKAQAKVGNTAETMTQNAPQTPPAAWYPDPDDASQFRYWDGTAWTEHRAPIDGPTA